MNQEPQFSVTPPQPPPPSTLPPTKQRHGCLTAWLVLMIIANSLVSILYVTYLLGSGNGSNLPAWSLFLLIILGIGSVICALMIFRWRKFGFWGYCLLGVLAIVINLALGAGLMSFTSLISVAVLYAVLQIGKTNKGWPQLE